jgi:hypothetical protein
MFFYTKSTEGKSKPSLTTKDTKITKKTIRQDICLC